MAALPIMPRASKSPLGYKADFTAALCPSLYASPGIGQVIRGARISFNILPKLASGQRPNVIDLMKNKDIAFVINTPSGKNTREDEIKIRTAAMQNRIPIMTTLRGADAALMAIKSLQASEVQVRALQEYHK